ncbi:hypothetical protein TNCT_729161 [Trichonephila clavata]|uniref:Uncharacterized protein n=1 Tax=Trichonephila clavata TaxID=2740835 RepID=A0A8X6IDV4_TRICU|nr:hypothetical protein TNCT_729161 [Trichonephila clavata]
MLENKTYIRDDSRPNCIGNCKSQDERASLRPSSIAALSERAYRIRRVAALVTVVVIRVTVVSAGSIPAPEQGFFSTTHT